MEPPQITSNHDPILWKQAKARVGFKTHLRAYLIVNAGLWLIWALTTVSFKMLHQSNGGWFFPWPLFSMLGWGIGLASHYYAVYHGKNERSMIEKEYEKLLSQRNLP